MPGMLKGSILKAFSERTEDGCGRLLAWLLRQDLTRALKGRKRRLLVPVFLATVTPAGSAYLYQGARRPIASFRSIK